MSGTSGLNAVERFIVGSVSEAIVRHAPCDVLVVRTEEMPEDFQPQVATPQLREKSRLVTVIDEIKMRLGHNS